MLMMMVIRKCESMVALRARGLACQGGSCKVPDNEISHAEKIPSHQILDTEAKQGLLCFVSCKERRGQAREKRLVRNGAAFLFLVYRRRGFCSPLPVFAALAGLDDTGSNVSFPLGLVIVEGDDYIGEEDDVGDDGCSGAGVG